MSNAKKRLFSEYSGEDYYLCSECDSVYHGQQELCEHLAKHSNLRRQARKRICLRNRNDLDILDYTKKPQLLIPSNLTTNTPKMTGIEQLALSKKMNDEYYTYHQLKVAVDIIDRLDEKHRIPSKHRLISFMI